MKFFNAIIGEKLQQRLKISYCVLAVVVEMEEVAANMANQEVLVQIV